MPLQTIDRLPLMHATISLRKPKRAPQNESGLSLRGHVGDRWDELNEDLSSLVDRHALPASVIIEVTKGPADEVQSMLKRRFHDERELTGVMLRINGSLLGPITRKSLRESLGTAAGTTESPYEIGEGERGVLAGESTRYRLLLFKCAKGDSKAHRLFYDDRDLPHCPNSPDHGPMEFHR